MSTWKKRSKISITLKSWVNRLLPNRTGMKFDQVVGAEERMAARDSLVSIIIPSYNRYELLTHAIRSCIAQTHAKIEIVVVDDCSTDPRYRDGALEEFPMTKVLHLSINQREKYRTGSAQGMTRQEGINVASGQWIAFLDDDDLFLPHKIQVQLSALFRRKMLFCSTNMVKVTHRKISTDGLSLNIGPPYFEQRPPEILTAQKLQRLIT